jgi:hypothetical protein
MNALIVHSAFHQKNANGKAVKSGAGVCIRDHTQPFQSIIVSDTEKYGALWLQLVDRMLNGMWDNDELEPNVEVRFLTGFPNLVSIQGKVNKALCECLKQKVANEDQVDAVVRKLSNYERRTNHDLYVALVSTAVDLSYKKININFYDVEMKTQDCGALWDNIRRQVDPDYVTDKRQSNRVMTPLSNRLF